MLTAPLRTAAALLAVTASLIGAATANATRVTSHPTGNANLDAYCQAAADLINDAFHQADHADNLGFYDEGQAYWDTAIEMLCTAKANGCNFTAAAVANGTGDGTVVMTRPTGDARLDQRCRQYATAINWAFSQGQGDYARAQLRGAQQKGCRYVVVHRVGAAPQAASAAATMSAG